MYRSPSAAKNEDGIKYDVESLDFFLDHIGRWLELNHDSDDTSLEKDAECDPSVVCTIYHLKGITNGEFYWELYRIFQELTNDEPAKELIETREAILWQIVEHSLAEFKDRISDDPEHGLKYYEDDLWRLYACCCKNQGLPIWTDSEGGEVTPPQLKDLTGNDWDQIGTVIEEEFFWDHDWEMFENFSQQEWQPHFPNHQEYRTATFWFDLQYRRINHKVETANAAGNN